MDSEHPNFEHYKSCKKRILHSSERIFLNADDAYYPEFTKSSKRDIKSFGIEKNADISAQNIEVFKAGNIFGVSFECIFYDKNINVTLPIPGNFSVYNALAAISVCNSFGISVFDCVHALETVRIRGRFEIVPISLTDITCIIDYAHNGKSLMRVLETIKNYRPKRIICVFGSVGGRTKSRRKEMALAANALADICIVTSDNPDSEDPSEIIGDIAQYIYPEKCYCEIDREKAIYYALRTAEPGDFVLFAGKGHEEYQLINGEKTFFSEKEIIRQASLQIESEVLI